MEERDNSERPCQGSIREVGCEPEWITGVSQCLPAEEEHGVQTRYGSAHGGQESILQRGPNQPDQDEPPDQWLDLSLPALDQVRVPQVHSDSRKDQTGCKPAVRV